MTSKSPERPERFPKKNDFLSPFEKKRFRTTENSFQKFTYSARTSMEKSLNFIGSYYDRTSEIYDIMIPEDTKEVEMEVEILKDIEFDPKPNDQNPKDGYSFSACLLIFLKMNIVSSFLFLPSGFQISGWLFSAVTVTIYTIMMCYSAISLSNCSDRSNFFSYSQNAYFAFGKVGKYIAEILIAVLQICFPITYVNLTISLLNTLIQVFAKTKNDFYWYLGIAEIIVFIPLCFIRKVAAFAKLHLLGDISVLVTLTSLIYYCSRTIINEKDFNIDNFKLINHNWAQVIGMTAAMIEGMATLLPIKESLNDKTQFNRVIITGCVIIWILLVGFPVFVVFTFGNNVPQIILENLPFNKLYVKITIILLVFSIVVVYPLAVRPSFKIIEHYLCCKKNVTLIENLIRSAIVLFTTFIGIIAIGHFGKLLTLAGCILCLPVTIIIPNLIHFKMFKHDQSTFRSVMDMVVIVAGISASLIVLVFVFIIN